MNVFYNDFKSIYSQLYTLPRARIQLRRNFGKYPKDVDMKTKVSFYEVVGGCSCIKKLDDLNLFIVTLIAAQIDKLQSGLGDLEIAENIKEYNIQNYLHKIYVNSKTSESQKRRITKLLAMQYEQDGRLLGQMTKFIQLAHRDGYKINPIQLYADIKYWNANHNEIPEKWARVILRVEGDNSND